jgi:hypothetical protein
VGNFLTSWAPVSFSGMTLLHGVSKSVTKHIYTIGLFLLFIGFEKYGICTPDWSVLSFQEAVLVSRGCLFYSVSFLPSYCQHFPHRYADWKRFFSCIQQQSVPCVTQLAYMQKSANTRHTVRAATSSRDKFWNNFFAQNRSSGWISNEPLFCNAMMFRLHTLCAL